MNNTQVEINLQPEWDKTLGIWKNFKAAGSFDLPDPLWIFGYGSLCYKTGDIKFVEEKNGFIKNFTRRFWQKSCDHRGTPENPGLVCTLLCDEEWLKYGDKYEHGIVYGKAFRIDNKNKDERKRGYSQIILDVFLDENGNDELKKQTVVKALLYKGNVDNPNFVQDEIIRNSVSKQAEIIQNSIGPSGKNIEYLMEYYQYLKSLDRIDKYMEDLVLQTQQYNKKN